MNKLHNDPTGKRFGRLTVVKRVENSSRGKSQFLCKCDCGREKIIPRNAFMSGGVKSCGCLLSEKSKIRATKHGLRFTRLYRIWCDMKSRCNAKTGKAYQLYVLRGISVCDEWKNNFQAFYNWAMSNGYSDELTIDRINNDGNYEPTNCRWATYSEQNKNKRRKLT
mgnify:FL=1|jgi:hypothetical protein